MARNQTLGQILDTVRIEAGLDPDPALSINVRPLLVQLIRREYERLYDEFDWPFLRLTEDIDTVAGERHYDFPDAIDLERVEEVHYRWADRWLPLERGICQDDYNAHDSDNDVRVDPAMRWDVVRTGSREQCEIWPIPLTGGSPLRFTGIKKKTELVADSDRCDLDGTMVALFAASEYLVGRDNATAQIKQQKAVERFRMVRGRTIQKDGTRLNFAGGSKPEIERVPLVAYVRNP